MAVQTLAGGSDMEVPPAKVATLGPDLQRNIGRQLRSLYDEVLNEPVPDRLRELLQQLDRKAPER
jgi:hypothetical protein